MEKFKKELQIVREDTVQEPESELMIELFDDILQRDKGYRTVLARVCDYRGTVMEDSNKMGMNHCHEEDCKGCNAYAKKIDDAVKEWLRNELNKEDEHKKNMQSS